MDGPLPLNRLSAPLYTANAVLRARSRTHFVKDFPGPIPWNFSRLRRFIPPRQAAAGRWWSGY